MMWTSAVGLVSEIVDVNGVAQQLSWTKNCYAPRD